MVPGIIFPVFELPLLKSIHYEPLFSLLTFVSSKTQGYSLEQMEVVFGNVPDPKTTLAEEDGRSDSAAPGTQPRTIDGDTGETAKSP